MRARKVFLPLLLAFGLLLGCSCAAETAAPAKEALIRNTAGLGKTTTYRLQDIAPAEISHTGTLTVSESLTFYNPIFLSFFFLFLNKRK